MNPLLDPLVMIQHGAISRAQCLTAGLSRTQIQHLIDDSRLVRVFSGVYRDPASPTTIEQRAMAAVLAGGDWAMASHRMAIGLWGMRNYRCQMAEITSPRLIDREGITAHRCGQELRSTLVRGVPVTSPARTLLDVATVMSRGVMVRFVETWLSTGVVRLARLEEEVDRSPRHRGRAALQGVLKARFLTAGEADSPAESKLGEVLVRHGLPTPVLHHLVSVSSGAEFELDWSYPDWRLAFELDGYGVHLRSLDAFEHDRLRRNELEIDGWTVMNFTRRLVESRPLTVVDQVRRMIATKSGTDS